LAVSVSALKKTYQLTVIGLGFRSWATEYNSRPLLALAEELERSHPLGPADIQSSGVPRETHSVV